MNAVALMGKFLRLGRTRNQGNLDTRPAVTGGWHDMVSLLARERVGAPEADAVEAALRKALANDLFFLEYQPIFDLAGKVVEVEALLRSHEPLLQKIGPSEYIRVAEESNLILPVGERVLQMACRSLAEWRSLELDDVTVAVNVSCMQLVSPGFAEFAICLFEKHQLPPSAIHMEVTETVLTRDTSSMLPQMTALAEAGVCFSIDDFGTGYSTLERLSRLPISTMKIDQGFVREIHSNSRMSRIIHGMVDLGRHLGMTVIAEGVETREQFELLRAVGCEKFQGYLFSKPMGELRIQELLVANYSLALLEEPLAPVVGC